MITLKDCRIWGLAGSILLIWPIVMQSAPFINLDFEAANLPVIPEGQYGGFAPIGEALPGWRGFLGSNPQPTVLHNSIPAGGGAIIAVGPDYAALEGRFSVFLLPGSDPNGPPISTDTSISQTGLVPAGSRSLLFKARVGGSLPSQMERFGLFFGEEKIAVIPLSSTPTYTLYGGDVSPFADLEVELRFTVNWIDVNNSLALDSISFSAEPIPEPRALSLLGLCCLWLVRGLFKESPALCTANCGVPRVGTVDRDYTCFRLFRPMAGRQEFRHLRLDGQAHGILPGGR